MASANAIASLDEETPEQKAARYKAGSRTHLQIGGIFLTTFFADAWASEGATLMHLTVWCWALHTLYFLIPVNSCRPVSRLLHGPSYVIAHALAAMWLWSLYAARGAELEMAPDGRPEFFSLLATKAHGIAPPAEPRPGDKSPGGPASGEALLVAWTVDDAAPAAAAPPEPAAKLFQPADARIAPAACPPAPAKRRPAADDESSDDDVLGDVCQWRACVCARAPAPARNDDAPSPPGARRKKKKRAPRPLCAWHQALKAHLDAAAARANKPSDAARFLPRAATAKVKLIHAQLSKQGARAPAADYAEAAAIKGASPLLTELANGKLGATVRVFCRRAANESAERHGAAARAAIEAELPRTGAVLLRGLPMRSAEAFR